MTRRSTGLSVLALILLLFGTFSVGSLAVEAPQVLQVSDPSYSATDRATINQALTALENALQERLPIPSFRLTARGWQDREFAMYAAGRLEAAGFQTLIVQGSTPDGLASTWILVGVPLEGNRTAWLPVNAFSSQDMSGRIGSIAWQTVAGGAFATEFTAPTSVIELSQNLLPTATFVVMGQVTPHTPASIHSTSQDRDGSIIAYVWQVNGEQVSASSSAYLSYSFPGANTYTVTLTVYDNRGGAATTSKSVKAEDQTDCGCNRP